MLADVSAITASTVEASATVSSPLVVTRWLRYGKRRLYVKTADGTEVGWVDLVSGERSLAMAELADAFEAAIAAKQSDVPEPCTARRALEEQVRKKSVRTAVVASEYVDRWIGPRAGSLRVERQEPARTKHRSGCLTKPGTKHATPPRLAF